MDVTKLLVKKIKNDDNYDKYIENVDDRPFNDKRYLISNDKLKELGWKQKISFDDGIDLLLKYNDDTMIILFKPNEEDLRWNNFYDKLKDTLGYNIKVYSDNLENIYDLINFMKNNKDFKNFLIIDEYNKFNYEGLNKNIDNFNNLHFKNICSSYSFDDKLLDLDLNDSSNDSSNDFSNNLTNILININKLNKLDKEYNFESFKNLKINLLNYFFVIYNNL